MTNDTPPKRKRGRPPLVRGALPAAVRSSRAEAKRAAERAGILLAWARTLRTVTLRKTDTVGNEVLDALATALVGIALDLHAGPGEGEIGADAALRAATRSFRAAVADQLDEDGTAAKGAIQQALDETD